MSLPGRWLFGFLPLLGFVLHLIVLFSSFLWLLWWSLWLYYCTFCEFFTPAVSLSGVWMTASLLKFPGLFSVFWPILLSGWSQFFLCFPVSPVLSLSPWELFKVHQLLLVSLSPSYSTAFLVLWQGPSICQCFHFLLFFLCGLPEWQKSTWQKVLFYLLINTRPGLLTGIRGFICISKFQRILYVSFFKTDSH